MNPESEILREPILERELQGFLLSHPGLANKLAIETQGMTPQESMTYIARAMREMEMASWSQDDLYSRKPSSGSQPCPGCGRPISANKSQCKECANAQTQA